MKLKLDAWKRWARERFDFSGVALLSLVVLMALTGCETTGPAAPHSAAQPAPTSSPAPSASKPAPVRSASAEGDLLRPNDMVSVLFAGVASAPSRHDERIKEDGSLTLPLNLHIRAAGKTPGQLQKDIYDLYVPKYFREQLTITVAMENRFFYVDGDVRTPNRYVYAGEMTVMKAIAAAGGFTDFADRKRVALSRSNGEKLIINCEKAIKNPALDRAVFPGDQIVVRRRIF